MEKNHGKTIKLSANTYRRLEALGKKGETFDSIVQKLLDEAGA